MSRVKAGDFLASITTPGQFGQCWHTRDTVTVSIEVDELPGPMGYYLVAVVRSTAPMAKRTIPLHMAESWEIQ